MGIFDDAIRQHLDLKRRQGAEETELKQLEDEAFGPPARPGEPEFGETGEQAEVESPDAEHSVQAPSDPAVPELGDEPAAEGATFTTAEREAIADQPTTFFDHQLPEDQPEVDLDVDLDLDLEEELEEVDALAEEPMSEPPGAPAIEPEPAVEPEPTADADLLERDPVEEEQAVDLAEEESDPEPAGADQAADDVLEETPEFLRDNPDDDELWFEQGEPKDFDFK